MLEYGQDSDKKAKGPPNLKNVWCMVDSGDILRGCNAAGQERRQEQLAKPRRRSAERDVQPTRPVAEIHCRETLH
eukprot:scaffold29611_cov96-Isochrysis_galbana.AAC.1